MTYSSTSVAVLKSKPDFKKNLILPVVFGHFIHDVYTASVAPLLPLLMEKMALTLTQVGSLQVFQQLPGLLNPLIGYVADRGSGRYFVILAPAITGTLISSIGFAPDYWALALLLFCVGVSTASFHAPGPAIIGKVAGRRLGLGMSLFMVGGESAFTVGPLLAVWAVSTWTLDGFWRIVILGWAASLLLFWRFGRRNPGSAESGSEDDPQTAVAASWLDKGAFRQNLHALAPGALTVFLPLAFLNLFRHPLMEALSTFLPIFMTTRGAGLWMAGATLSIYQFAGILGVLFSGPLSDRLGRRKVLVGATLLSVGLALLFLNLDGWLSLIALLALGFFSLSTYPVMMAIVQECFPEQRATANGLYMMMAFVLRPIGTLTVGFLGDRFGLQNAYTLSALISLLAIPAILALPRSGTSIGAHQSGI